MKEVYVVFKTHKDGTNTLHDVFDSEKSAERSVRGIITRYKEHRSITGGFYEKYRRDSITEKDLEGLMVFGWGGYLKEKYKRGQSSYFKSGKWGRGMRIETTARSSGKRARSNGEFFERVIEVSCRHYKKIGAADIQKTPEPMRVLAPLDRKKGTFKACFAKQAQPDFKGVLQGGQAIIFEAKHTESNRVEQNRLTAEQVSNFNSQYELGAKCFVLVSFQMKRFYKVPWPVWEDMQEIFKKKSVNEKDIAEYQIEYKSGVLHFINQYE